MLREFSMARNLQCSSVKPECIFKAVLMILQPLYGDHKDSLPCFTVQFINHWTVTIHQISKLNSLRLP